MGNEGDNGGQANENGNNLPPNKRFYKVAFSFTSGKDDVNRNFVRKVAEALRDTHKVPQELIFYDKWVGMEGTPSANKKFLEIYGKRSEYIVPFFCENYNDNNWTKIEGRTIQIVRDKTADRVIPARFDKIKNIRGFEENSDLFINCFSKSDDEAESVAKKIFNKINQLDELIKLTHVNGIAHDLNNQPIKFGLKYIELRDVFIDLGYEHNRDHIELLQKHSHKWEYKEYPFNKTQLEKNLAEVFDYIYNYSIKNNNIRILIKFLCTLRTCEILDDFDDKIIKSAITTACQNLDIKYDELCSNAEKVKKKESNVARASTGQNLPPNKRFYKVAFSFTSGKDDVYRNFVKKVAEALRDIHEVPQELIFFDEWANLCGRADADLLLEEIYKDCSEYIVPFFSKDYLEKYWTSGVEYEAIRITKRKYPKAIIPAKLEDIKIKGFPDETNFFINCYEEKETYETVAKTIADRIKEEPPRLLICASRDGDGDNGDSDDNTFPFTNRKKELELILTSKIKDQLITAPVSYGKKTFLKKLEEEFKKEGYVTFLKEITDQNTVASDNDLCRYFGFKNSEDFITQKLTNNIETKIKNKGFIFLFITRNIIGKNLKLLKDSVNTLRYQIKNRLLAVDPNYQHHDNKIRLIVSSRQLYGDPRNVTDWPYGYESVWLSEFTDQVILDSLKAKNFFLGKSEEEYTSIVAKLTLLTAGHPAIVKSTAENYKIQNDFNINQIRDNIRLFAQQLAVSINDADVSNLFLQKQIPLFRYIDTVLLKKITHKESIKCEEIFASLFSHGIYKKAKINGAPSKVIKDSLLRRTCAIDYCYQQADQFLKSANIAKDFYYKQFDNGQCRLDFMILWLVESWYNDLQKKLLSFSWSEHEYNDKVGNINKILFKEIPTHINLLLNQIETDGSKPEEGEKRLLERLEHDWEFKLLLSYLPYKPDTQCYNTDAYSGLVSLIKDTFAGQ